MHEAAITRLCRVIAVLAVIAGVIAMHGLASHHGATAAPVVSASLASVEAGHTHAAPAVSPTGVIGHDCDLLCRGGGDHAVTLLCTAVLLAAAGTVLVLRQRTGPLPRRTGPPAVRVTRSTALPRSFDLVSDLCISRT